MVLVECPWCEARLPLTEPDRLHCAECLVEATVVDPEPAVMARAA